MRPERSARDRTRRQRKVDVHDQFGGQTYIVIGPRMLCVPATKRHLD